MSDITKCKGTDCPVKEGCYRFTAPDNGQYQSYFVEVPGWYRSESKTFDDSMHNTRTLQWNCDMFWGKRQETILSQLNKIVGNDED